MVEVTRFPHRQFLAVSVGEFVEFCWRLFRPDWSIQVGKGVNQFVGFTDDTDERGTLSQGLHGGHAHSLHGVSCEGDTRSESVKGGGGSNLFLAVSARCVALEGEQQIERLAAFQHPNRTALASLVYETSPQ